MKRGAGFFIALRYLLGRAHEGGRYLRGAVAGIAVSLIPIVVTLIVADGMIRGITDRYLELGTGHMQVYNFRNPLEIENAADTIVSMEGVRGAWAERQGLGVLVGANGKTGANIRAVEPSFWLEGGGERFLTVPAGSAELESDREVLLGEDLAAQLGVSVGDTVRLMTIRVSADGRNIPRLTPFTVKGVVSSGYRELDSLWCIMTYAMGKRLLAEELSYSYLMVKIDDPYDSADLFSHRILRALGPGYTVYTWKELQRSQYSSYESTRQILLLIMALIVVIAAVNVSSATAMLAIERRRDIAVLKAFGASPRGTTRIFIWGALLTGIIGAAIGLSLGLVIGSFINPIVHGLESVLSFFSRLFSGTDVKILDPGYYLEQIPIIVDWSAITAIGIFTVVCSVAASWLPARRAGKIPPVELLRKY
ncbi:ABC transporter permease [Breznakiella homolactica]|uniref:ABC transporter permease n=1 Tax=Breznakiella homolactica TaxID=2798577 RepID=A0A7T7XKY3_9SPIR|nr:ABC transporter permease [Breznakiella homolactica]QQO08281.1 ABC transporter permease [Breznakiella homolactica]